MPEKTRNGKTLRAWMREVDRCLLRKCGLTTDDLADQCYWDAWNDEVSPADMAERVLEYEGFPG